MIQTRRFGKRVAVPSTVQILRELRALMGWAPHGTAPATPIAVEAPIPAQRVTPEDRLS